MFFIGKKSMQLKVNIAAEINYHHQTAIQQADEAVRHAEAAGKLLLEVKESLPHGEFGKWVDTNVTVSMRQAQRYMAVAQGKPVPVRALGSKNDTVSHLIDESDKWTPRPKFIPLAGFRYCSGSEFVVEPSAIKGFFYVSHLLQDEDAVDTMRRPIRAAWVESCLIGDGLANPADADWVVAPCDGVAYAMQSLGLDRPIVKRKTLKC
jgi:Protein of unknown function (DUF3102)